LLTALPQQVADSVDAEPWNMEGHLHKIME
jgi:hypothetical protein